MDNPTGKPGGTYNFNGTTYTYTRDGIDYIWDLENSVWKTDDGKTAAAVVEKKDSDDEQDGKDATVAKCQDMTRGQYGYDGETDTRIYTDPSDGTIYFWDKEKNAWFPKIDDDFIAYYQMYNYGGMSDDVCASSSGMGTKITPDETAKTTGTMEEKIDKERSVSGKRKTEPEPPKWFDVDDKSNTKVYVSNLPLDITEEEFVDVMQKCGLVMKDIDTGKMKVKLYTERNSDILKGDALCTYIKRESVDLALSVLDGYDLRGSVLKVEKAKFSMKGNAYDAALKPKKKRRKDKEKLVKMQEKLFDWRPEKMRGERSKHESVVVIKNLFEPAAFETDLGLILEFQQDVREECSKCGSLKRVVIYDKHEEGVAQVWFKEAEAADACVKLLNGRWFNQRKITAETWDGKTKYKIEETAEEKETRLKKWENFLISSKDGAAGGEGGEPSSLENKPSAEEEEEEEKEGISAGKGEESDDTRSSADSGDETDD